ncbi:hypothetical protein A2706_02340 [Candidatus Peribacteria bacterium RIFCSPHIGHO2_01_FULL_51_35]|nr:MAG: hypothetical protein A2706_02340 [Candidatus Peribacteria bacterium RIFCSPHIGHO2_01_FULL_51_35]
MHLCRYNHKWTTPYLPTYERQDRFINEEHARIPQIVAGIEGWLNPEDAWKLYEMAYFANGPILEIGTYRGKSTTVLALGIRASGRKTRLITIDRDSASVSAAENAVRLFAGNVDLQAIKGESTDILRSLNEYFTFVFVDADHSANGAREDLQVVDPLLLPGGFLLLHDLFDERNEREEIKEYGVPEGVFEALGEEYLFYGRFGCTGLFRKREKESMDAAEATALAHVQNILRKEQVAHAATRERLDRLQRSGSYRMTAFLRNLGSFTEKVNDVLRKPRSLRGANRITVIIPILNAFDHMKRCIESVLLHTDPANARILLMDDGSTDERIPAFLAEIATSHPDFVSVMRNEKNLGFVQTANKGMKLAAPDDVVLLNSDTIVTQDWLTLLRETVAEKRHVGSVIPLSNNASMYSVLHDSISEHPRDIDLAAASVRKQSGHYRPRIPTSVGFCMLITRDALEHVGDFDTAFGRGYGEENDWCMRATEKGFAHYLDDRCFVFHAGGVSMRAVGHLPEGKISNPANEALLEQKHPSFRKKADAFAESKVLKRIRQRALRSRTSNLTKPRTKIGFLLHQHIDAPDAGGTEWHVHDLVEELRQTNECIVLFPKKDRFLALRHVNDLCMRYEFPLLGNGEERLLEAFRRALTTLEIDLLHVHHLLGMHAGLLSIPREADIPFVVTIHDQFLFSPTPHPSVFTDDRRNGFERTVFATLLRPAARIIAPSRSAAQNFEQAYPQLNVPIVRIEHGMHCHDRTFSSPPLHPTVCFLGATHFPRKGRDVIEKLAEGLLAEHIRIVFAGSTAEDWPTLNSRRNIRFLGRYDRADAVSLLKKANPSVVCILSMFAESFCFTALEALCAGLPLYVTPAGALPEMIERSKAGRVATGFDPAIILPDLLSYVLSDACKEDRLRAMMFTVRSRKEMADGYGALYAEVLAESAHTAVPSEKNPREIALQKA